MPNPQGFPIPPVTEVPPPDDIESTMPKSRPEAEPSTVPGPPPFAIPMAPRSSFAVAFRTLCDVPLLVWRGDLVGALRASALATLPANAGWRWWWMVCAVNALIAGITGATSIAKSYNATVGSLIGFVNDWSGSSGGETMPFGVILVMILTGAIAIAACLTLRVATVMLTFRLRSVATTFASASALVAVSQAIYTFPMAAMMLINFLPAGVALVLSPVTAFVFVALLIISEVSVYVGLNKVARMEKSPVVPHAVLTTVWIGLSVVTIALVNLLVLAVFS